MNVKKQFILGMTIASCLYIVVMRDYGIFAIWILAGIFYDSFIVRYGEVQREEEEGENDDNNNPKKWLLKEVNKLAYRYKQYKFTVGYDDSAECYIVLYELIDEDIVPDKDKFQTHWCEIADKFDNAFMKVLCFIDEKSTLSVDDEYGVFNDD